MKKNCFTLFPACSIAEEARFIHPDSMDSANPPSPVTCPEQEGQCRENTLYQFFPWLLLTGSGLPAHN
jgi:hypothetical protein